MDDLRQAISSVAEHPSSVSEPTATMRREVHLFREPFIILHATDTTCTSYMIEPAYNTDAHSYLDVQPQ